MMMNSLRRRFWIELGATSVTLLVFMITVTHSDWIELVSGFDPDMGSGALEWALGAGLTLVVIAAIVMMRYEWARAKRSMQSMAKAPALTDDSRMPSAMNR
ncbi:MAG TPA: hypothetical protein VFQ25_07205 [Ktedonobacterales bacterium]|nr:hypothetical protein [Ktedonobacterales bacterium]